MTLRPPDYSDAGNAAVFSRVYADKLLYTDSMGWFWWNGSRWERSHHKATELAMQLSERMLHEAQAARKSAQIQKARMQAEAMETGRVPDMKAFRALETELESAGAYLIHAKRLRAARQLQSMVELSKAYLHKKADCLDANPMQLNTPAGIVDLATGALLPHDRRAYCSRITAASPGSQGREMWNDFLRTVTCGDDTLRGFLQLAAGMALVGKVYQEGILIAYGGGRNGKSTLFNALGQVLGDYAGSIDVRTLTTDQSNKGAALATLRGKRLVVTGELEEHQRLSSAILKQLASTDKLNIEEKYKQPETVEQSHTLVLFTNHLPRVGSTDSGTWRRIQVIPFCAVIPPSVGIQNYAEALARDAGGAILAWAIEGAVSFIRNGFKLDICDAVAEATDAYRQQEDWLKNFIGERCVRNAGSRIGARKLYLAYKRWAEELAEYVRRERDFSVAMEAAGFQKVKINGKPTYNGLCLDTLYDFAA